MSEGEESRKVRKTGSPQERTKNREPGTRKEEHSAIDTPHSEVKEPLTIDNSPLTTRMEVHHHPQLEHKPKPWKEYLLEYFMIFLAVMTGFFAESYREHLGERSKEYEYVVNIRKDLLTETANLNIWIPSIYARIAKFDTLISYLEATAPVKDGSNMYYLARLSNRNGIFEPSDNSILEMKSLGNMRLIRNHDIVNNLMNIERLLEQYRNLIDIEGKEDILSYPLLGSLFDAKVFDRMVSVRKNRIISEQEYAKQSMSQITMPPGNPQLINHDKEKVNMLIYYLHQRKSSFLGESRQLMGIRQQVEQLIQQLNREYKLGDE